MLVVVAVELMVAAFAAQQDSPMTPSEVFVIMSRQYFIRYRSTTSGHPSTLALGLSPCIQAERHKTRAPELKDRDVEAR